MTTPAKSSPQSDLYWACRPILARPSGKSFDVVAVQEDEAEEVLVPQAQKVEDGDGHQTGAGEREHYLPEGALLARAVEERRLAQFGGQGLHERGQREDRERQARRHIDQNDAEVRVVQRDRQLAQSQGANGRREKCGQTISPMAENSKKSGMRMSCIGMIIPARNRLRKNDAPLELEARERVGRHRTDRHQQHQADSDDIDAVEEVLPEVIVEQRRGGS